MASCLLMQEQMAWIWWIMWLTFKDEKEILTLYVSKKDKRGKRKKRKVCDSYVHPFALSSSIVSKVFVCVNSWLIQWIVCWLLFRSVWNYNIHLDSFHSMEVAQNAEMRRNTPLMLIMGHALKYNLCSPDLSGVWKNIFCHRYGKLKSKQGSESNCLT